MPPIYLDRDTLNSFQSDAIGQQADLTKQSLANPPPHEPVPPPSPPPIPPTPDTLPAEPTPSSDSLTNPTRQAPPDLQSLMTAAGIVSPPADSAAPASTTGPAPVTPAPSGPPALGDLLRSAGLGDMAGAVGSAADAAGTAVRGAVDSVTRVAPPPLQDVMARAGLDTNALPDNHPAAQPQDTSQNIMAKAQQFLGQPYVWGGKDPNTGFDCSGFAGYIEGTGQPESTTSLYGKSGTVDPGQLKPGDLVFYNMGQSDMHLQHVAVYIGDGKIVQAGGSQDSINIADVNQKVGSPPEFRRLNAGADQRAAGAPAQLASMPQAATQTTAGLSGGGDASGQVGDRGQQILSGAANAASWLGDQGQKALQAVLVTEGGLNNARGDQGKSAGPLQFYEGGQLANLASQMSMTLEQAKQWVEQNPVAAVQWAIGTPDKPGYLGAAIQQGIKLGLSGPDLATYAQQHGQVSVSPERAGANWDALFSNGQSVIQSATGAVQGATQAANQAGQDLLNRAGQLVQSGGDLLTNLQNQGQTLEDYTKARLAPINAEADRLTTQNRQATEALQQRNQQTMQQESVNASHASANQPMFMAPMQPASPTPPPTPPQGPLDIVKQKFGDALDALGGLLGGATQAVQGVTGALGQAAQTAPLEGGGYGAAGPLQPGEAAAALQPVGAAMQAVNQSPLNPINIQHAGEQAVGQGISSVLSGQAKNAIADQLEQQANNAPLGPAVPAPIQNAALNLTAGLLRAPGVLDSMQTISDLTHKYGATDVSQWAPEDQDAYRNAIIAVGGLVAPSGSEFDKYGVALKQSPELTAALKAPRNEPAPPQGSDVTLQGLINEAKAHGIDTSDIERQVAEMRAPATPTRQTPQATNGPLPPEPATNPFALQTQPGPNLEPITPEQAADHIDHLQDLYNTNDSRIQELENRLTGGVYGAGLKTGGVVRPPWAVGWTNDALTQLAQVHGQNAATDLWWERANLVPGSGELKMAPQEVPKNLRGAQQTPTEARSELARLQTQQQQIMDAVDHVSENSENVTTFYRPRSEVAPLPVEEYHAPANAAAEPNAPTAIPDATRADQGSGVRTAAEAPGSAAPTPAPTGAAAEARPVAPPAPPPPPAVAPAVTRVALDLGADTDPSRAFDLNALAQMRQQFQAQQPPLLQGAGQAARRTPLDNFIGYTMSNMLWGVGTAVHITTSQMLQTLGRPTVEAAAGHPVEAVRDLAAMGGTISDAFAASGRTIQTGQRQGFALQTPPLPGAAGQVLGFPLRLHSSINEFFRTLNSAGASAAEASRLLRENPNLSFPDVLQKYTKQIVDAGADAAARATFMEGGGAMKEVGQKFGQMSRDLMNSNNPAGVAAGLVMRWIVPMTHIPAVILGEGIGGLPVVNEVRGVQRAIQLGRGTPARTLAGGQAVPAVAGDTYRAQQELARTALTSFANFAILSEVAQGNITGDGPTSPAERERLMEAVDNNGNAVWRPNSIKLPGGRWVDYTGLGPIALSMSSIANLVETAKDYANKPPEQRQQGAGAIPELGGDLLNREAGTIGKTWFLRGLADTLTMIKEGSVSASAGSEIGSIGDRLVPFGSLLNEVRNFTDQTQRNPQNPLERVESRIPGLSANVEPRLAASTGQPMGNAQDVASFLFRGTPPGMLSPNPVAAEIARLHDQGITVSLPYEVKTYKGAEQTSAQQQTIRQQVGTAVNLYASNILKDPRYAALSDEQKARALSQSVGQAQAQADLTLGGQVARSPHDSALLQWAETAHYYGIPKDSTPEQVAQANWEVAQAKAKLAEYRKAYGDRAEGQLHRDDPQAYKLSQREAIESDVLNARKRRLDAALGGALLQGEQNPATGGLVGAGSTVLRPPVP